MSAKGHSPSNREKSRKRKFVTPTPRQQSHWADDGPPPVPPHWTDGDQPLVLPHWTDAPAQPPAHRQGAPALNQQVMPYPPIPSTPVLPPIPAQERLSEVAPQLSKQPQMSRKADAQERKLDTREVTGKWLVETAALIVLAFVIAMGVRMFIVEPYRIPTGSMLPAIQIDDQILIYRLGAHLGSEPEAADIVVFYDPTGAFPNLVKRVIATEGQIVYIGESGEVSIDGQVISEPYVYGLPTHPLGPDPTQGAPIEYPFTVPEGTVWVMGDNRTNSADSRSFGPVPVSEVKGTAFFTYWPLSNFAPLE
ncbi:MAG: signal peptidase I [Coriobacteriia bacterium]|nr:signal peptidase I [Coriobacteriia bacterium]